MAKGIKDPGKFFYVCDGRVLKSYSEFKQALKAMSDDAYKYHADRGDFAKWLGDVLKKKTLAKKITGLDRKKAIKLLG